MADRLTLHSLVRRGERTSIGTDTAERHFLDFVINGKSLWEAVGRRHDTVSILCSEFLLKETIEDVNRLLLKEKANAPNDRRSLFICSQCGDLGCGAITLSVVREGDTVIWKNFAYENNYEPEIDFREYESVGPFQFDGADYERTLREGMDTLKTAKS
jgi:hypothetical protein